MRTPPLAVSLSLSALVLGVAACTTTPPADTGGPLPPMEASCNADAARAAIGRLATPDVVERARIDAGARVARVLHPGQVVTMEYMEGRLNVDVNEREAIVGLRCG